MKTLIVFLFLIGIIFIIQSYYSEKLEKVQKSKTIFKYVPLNVYEGKMNGIELIDNHFKSQFERITE